MELNDPFEFLGADLSDRNFRKGMRQVKAILSETKGLICFSKGFDNPVLWGHYADKHRGICLGFDIPDESLEEVIYVNSRIQPPAIIDEAFVKKLLFTKFIHWSYEDEYRSYVSLDESEDGIYYLDFSESMVLRQVIVGSESKITRSELADALGDLAPQVETFQARPAFKSFRVVRNENARLWA